MLEFFEEFPEMSRGNLRDFKKVIDSAFRSFSRNNGEAIESFFDPILWFLIWFEKLLLNTPWLIIILVVAVLCYLGTRKWKLSIGSILTFTLIGYLGMWEDTMSTMALISVATLLCISIGIPIGVWMARSDRVQSLITPILDVLGARGRVRRERGLHAPLLPGELRAVRRADGGKQRGRRGGEGGGGSAGGDREGGGGNCRGRQRRRARPPGGDRGGLRALPGVRPAGRGAREPHGVGPLGRLS